MEIIRNRVDQFGVAEPLIQRQGEDRIAVQLPGLTDRQRAIDLIGKTALLEFKLVDDAANVEEAVRNGPPPGTWPPNRCTARRNAGPIEAPVCFFLFPQGRRSSQSPLAACTPEVVLS